MNALLRLSRSEAGLDPEHVERVEVAPLLETLVGFFEPLASERGLEIEAGTVPEAAVNGDRAWLQQMLSNLVDNAVKYCEPGARIRVEAEADKDEVRIRIDDTGPGIAPGDLAEIFDRFQRGAGQRNRPGFGLGLPLAREIARAHGGRIDVESRVGQGTRFTVHLPRAGPATGR